MVRNVIYDLETGRFEALPLGNPKPFGRFSPDGRQLLTGGSDGLCQLWLLDQKRSELLWSCEEPEAIYGFQVAFSPDGSRIAVPAKDGAWLLDARSGRRLTHLTGGDLMCFAWTPDGRRVATGETSGAVRLWDPSTGEELCRLGKHSSSVPFIGFLPGGRTLASASTDRTVKLWMTENRR
ncbi:hypothetical protein EON82_19060 [bacterium]|nr:MAG: hypothetical protein EON82_19060 [bacterium]